MLLGNTYLILSSYYSLRYIFPGFITLTPAYPTPIGSPPPENEPSCTSLGQNGALVAQFLVFGPIQLPLTHHPIAPSQYSTPVCHTPIASSLPKNKSAHTSLAKTKPLQLSFWFFDPNQPPSCFIQPHLPNTSTLVYPTPIGLPLPN